VDGDRKSAHTIAECLDPSTWRLTTVTNDSDRAIALLERSRATVLVAGISVCGGFTGNELLRALARRPGTGLVTVISSTAAEALLSQVMECAPDAVVVKPLRKSDVETAVRVAEFRASQRQSARTLAAGSL
jgi:DNA-binding NarL/FixJ family response regulator